MKGKERFMEINSLHFLLPPQMLHPNTALVFLDSDLSFVVTGNPIQITAFFHFIEKYIWHVFFRLDLVCLRDDWDGVLYFSVFLIHCLG